jgi:hypothetical protein
VADRRFECLVTLLDRGGTAGDLHHRDPPIDGMRGPLDEALGLEGIDSTSLVRRLQDALDGVSTGKAKTWRER